MATWLFCMQNIWIRSSDRPGKEDLLFLAEWKDGLKESVDLADLLK